MLFSKPLLRYLRAKVEPAMIKKGFLYLYFIIIAHSSSHINVGISGLNKETVHVLEPPLQYVTVAGQSSMQVSHYHRPPNSMTSLLDSALVTSQTFTEI